MRSEFRVTDHIGYLPRAPSFISDVEFGGSADGERWDQVETERCGVVVVDEENHVGRVVLHPLLGELITAEHFLPVRFLVPARVKRGADRRDVGGINGGGNP